LGAAPGDRIEGKLGRRSASGRLEFVTLPLQVAAVLPLEAEEKDVAFVPLELLEDVENYRDGFAVPSRGYSGEPPLDSGRRYGGFRLYARDLDSVSVLRDYFTRKKIEVITKSREIQAVKSLDRSLTVIFTLIAVSACAGFVAATTSSVLASVRRKDKHLAMIRLLGFSSAAIMSFPIVQSLATAASGAMLAIAGYASIAYVINAYFSEALYGQTVCQLPSPYFGGIFALVLSLSLLSSIQASIRAARIDPSEVLREL
jgi:putative ABC transport system permease protein